MRLQPRYGTLEVRVMDAQTTLARTAALVALVQALVRAECEPTAAWPRPALVAAHEVIEENRFLALRDGVDARFIDPEPRRAGPGRPTSCAASPRDRRRRRRRAARGLRRRAPAHARPAAPRGLISLVQDLVDRF